MLPTLLACSLALLPVVPGDEVAAEVPVLLASLETELDRSFAALQRAESEPLHFLSYRASDVRSVGLRAAFGAAWPVDADHWRQLDVEARVGSPALDSTHQIRGQREFGASPTSIALPLEDDAAAIRAAAWAATDRAFKDAQERFLKVKTNETVKVEAEDASADFASAAPATHFEPEAAIALDAEDWTGRLRRASAVFREYPHFLDGTVALQAEAENRAYVNSEGARLTFARTHYRITIQAECKAEDGMNLELYETFEAPAAGELPGEDALLAATRELATRLDRLYRAPVVEPFAGPAIIMNRACGVFFHEIFGHRIEGHRQKDVDEGQTFTKKIGQPVMPAFLTVRDDPTRALFGGVHLNGHYRFDDEGVPAAPVTLVEDGVLRGFVMSRSPIDGFPASNGHGRCSPGHPVVSRQGNLVVEARGERVPLARLREMLIEEVVRQGKPYGMIFHDISGGFTTTTRLGPQAFKVIPLYVVRVYADGREDEAVRGVDLVGTPLASISRIVAAADDDAVFNGVCGAESGWVPVSAVAPSVLVTEIEIEKKAKSQERPPLLPSPFAEEAGR